MTDEQESPTFVFTTDAKEIARQMTEGIKVKQVGLSGVLNYLMAYMWILLPIIYLYSVLVGINNFSWISILLYGWLAVFPIQIYLRDQWIYRLATVILGYHIDREARAKEETNG